MLFFSLIFFTLLAANTLSLLVKHRSLWEAAIKHQRIFNGVAKGGIFLYNKDKFIRITYDSSLVNRVAHRSDLFTIKAKTPFMYWKNGQPEDTLNCAANSDTLSQYRLAYMISPANSNVDVASSKANLLILFTSCLYYALFSPLFVNAHSALQVLASVENLVLALALLYILIQVFVSKKERFPVLVFLFFAFSLCLLFGLSTPNSGAIIRYRAPAVLFILLGALYYLPVSKTTFFKKFN